MHGQVRQKGPHTDGRVWPVLCIAAAHFYGWVRAEAPNFEIRCARRKPGKACLQRKMKMRPLASFAYLEVLDGACEDGEGVHVVVDHLRCKRIHTKKT